jgi:hypothetical protein
MYEVTEQYVDEFIADFRNDCEHVCQLDDLQHYAAPTVQHIALDAPLLVCAGPLRYLARPKGNGIECMIAADNRLAPHVYFIQDGSVAYATPYDEVVTADDLNTRLSMLYAALAQRDTWHAVERG